MTAEEIADLRAEIATLVEERNEKMLGPGVTTDLSKRDEIRALNTTIEEKQALLLAQGE